MGTSSPLGLLIFWIGTLISVPLCVYIGRAWRNALYVFFGLLVFSIFFHDWSIHFISRENYRAATRGFEVHLADIFALILLISMILRPNEFRIRFNIPLMIPYVLLIIVSIISWFGIDKSTYINFENFEHLGDLKVFELYLYPLFEIHKMIRGLFLYFVMVNFINNQTCIKTMAFTIGYLVVLITLMSLVNRYGWGQNRVETGGNNPNDLNSYIGIASLFVFPLAFSERKLTHSLFFWLVCGAGLLTIILTISRSSLAAFVLSSLIVVVVSLCKYLTKRNLLFTLLALCIGILVGAKSYDSLTERFFQEQSTRDDFDLRSSLNKSAMLMGLDHPFGVGLGNFHYWSMTKYGDIANTERITMCHNIWFLTFAELGFPGLVVFICFWLRYYQILLFSLGKAWWRYDRFAFPILLGAFSSMFLLQVQNLFHFSFRFTPVFFLSHIIIAASVRIYLELRESQPKQHINVQR